jgi:hypothetical protein
MPAAVKLRDDYSAEELRALARRSKDVNQSRDVGPCLAGRSHKHQPRGERVAAPRVDYDGRFRRCMAPIAMRRRERCA